LSAAAVIASARPDPSPGDRARSPFIVSVPAAMLKRNRGLSKNARRLHQAMRALADGGKGEVRKQGRWLRAEEIEKEAEMCRDIRMSCMRELRAAGLVKFERERVVRKLRGRRRKVLGRTRYIVLDSVEFEGKALSARGPARVLLQSISSTVEKIDSQVLPEAPSVVKRVENFKSSSKASPPPTPKSDDDSPPGPDWDAIESKIEELREEANRTLRAKGWNGHTVDAALQRIQERIDFSGSAPASPQYFLTSFDRAMSDDRDKKKIEERATRRAQFLGSDQEQLLRRAAELKRESQRSGREVRAIVEEQLVPAGTGELK
jgi:hypothetical protein